MAQYWEDWAAESLGAITAPAGWTKRWDVSGTSLSIVSDASAPEGKALRIKKSASDRFLLSFDAVDSDADRAACEVRALVRTPAGPGSAGMNLVGVTGRGSGTDTTETGYAANMNVQSNSGTLYNAMRLSKYVSGTATASLAPSAVGTDLWAFQEPYWIRLTCSGTTITWGIATAADPSTEVTGSLTDSSITAAGWVGLFCFLLNGKSVDVLAVGVGTNGDSAPLPTADTTAPTLTSPTSASTGATSGSGSVTTDEANGTLYAVATTSATKPSAPQVAAGLDHTGAAAPWDGSQAISSTGVKTFTVTGLSASTTYYLHFMHEDAATNQSAVETSAAFTTDTPDTTAPTLTDPTATATGPSTATGSVSTNEATGTLYFLASANASETVSTVKAGSSQAVSGTGVQNVSLTGLAAETGYYVHYVHTDAANNDSDVSTSNQITTAAGYVIRADYERSSINLSGSSVSGEGDAATITLKPRVQASQTLSGATAWLEPSARIDGVNGFRPTFKFTNYAATLGAGTYRGAPWQTTRRPMFSYDRETWTYFDTCTVGASDITFRHNTAFTSDTVYISRSRQVSVAQKGQWLDDLAIAYPTLLKPSAAALAFTPTLTTWPGQAFIAGEYSADTNELGQAIPATPFYSAIIDDGTPGKLPAFISFGVHAGEDHGCVVGMEAVEYLLGSSAEAVAMRSKYKIYLHPSINSPGRAGGGWRGVFTPGAGGADDANRNFNSNVSGLEIVNIPKAVIISLLGDEDLAWSIDFHGQFYGTWTTFDNNLATNIAFRTRMGTAVGKTFSTAGSSPAGTLENLYKTLGSPLTMTFESGDSRPVPDSEISTYAAAIVGVLDSMMDDGLIPVPVHALTATDLVTGSPVLGAPALTQAHALTAAGLTTSGPSLGAPALGQTHALIVSGITVEGPVLGAPTLAQTHTLTATGLTTSAPELGVPALGQIHSLTASDLTVSAPVLGDPALAQVHALAAAGITVEGPVLSAPTLAQIHALVASGLVVSAPELESPALIENAPTVDNLTVESLVVGSPVLGTPIISQVHALTSAGLTVSAPVLGTPALVENGTPIDALTASELTVGSPVLGTPSLGQAHVLGSDGIVTGAPVLGQPSIMQIHALTALGLVVGVPVLGSPEMSNYEIAKITEEEIGRSVSFSFIDYTASLYNS